MILDPNDPSGLGLFSKCARNHASRLKPHRPMTAGKHKSIIIHEDILKKKSQSYYTFDKQQSRQQRSLKYKMQPTPPVGKYNPIVIQKPKLVLDYLKIYSSRTRRKEKTLDQTKKMTTKTIETKDVKENDEFQQQINLQVGQPKQDNKNRQIFSSISNNRSQCMVNMSRTTGRGEEKEKIGSDYSPLNVDRSLNYIKKKTSKNILFQKQPKIRQNRYASINIGNSYNYDYNIIKIKKSSQLNFGIVKGRENNRMKTQAEYSYQHYDYNEYVWGRESNVYPNTKTHLIQFTKQIDRSRYDKT